MADLVLKVWDVTASRPQTVEVPDHVDVERLLAVLVERMNLPLTSPDGQIMVYKLHHKRSGRQLFDDQTLEYLGVRDRDELRIQPEITAG